MATQAEVRALHEADPRASAIDIADALGCSAGYVRATAQRLALSLPSSRRESIVSLGHAARDAGMTLADIAAWVRSNQRSSDKCETLSEGKNP